MRIYISHLLPDEEMREVIEKTGAGVESIEFSIAENLDRLEDSISSYKKRIRNMGAENLILHEMCIRDRKIAITSKKPQTTRNRIQTVYTCEQGQIIFQDTPGIHKAKNKLGEYMVNVAQKTLEDVDVILWLVEASTYIGPGEK